MSENKLKQTITGRVETLSKTGWEVSARLSVVLAHLRGPVPCAEGEGKPHCGLVDVLDSAQQATCAALMALNELEDVLGLNQDVHDSHAEVHVTKSRKSLKGSSRTLS